MLKFVLSVVNLDNALAVRHVAHETKVNEIIFVYTSIKSFGFCHDCMYGLCQIASFMFELIDFEVWCHNGTALDDQMFVREEAYVKDLTEVSEVDFDVSFLDELLKVKESNDSPTYQVIEATFFFFIYFRLAFLFFFLFLFFLRKLCFAQ